MLEAHRHRVDTAAPAPRRARRAREWLPPADFLALLGTGYLVAWLSEAPMPQALAWAAAVLAAFMLHDAHAVDPGAHARGARWRAFAGRAFGFVAVLVAIAFAARWLEHASLPVVAAWLALGVAACVGIRLALLPHAPERDEPTRARAARIGACLPVTVLADRPIQRWHAVAKAAMDYGLGGLATLLLLPLLGAIALAIRLDDPGPVLFKQRRHGYNNREFEIYKFRTMRLGANPSDAVLQQTLRGDPRITRVGRFLRKWSLDELPQLFNVMRGEMSLVGPRPHAVVMRTEDRLGEEIVASYPHRHRVKPGITGWAQVHGARGATDTEAQLRRRIELDLYYIEHCSPLLDLKVLVLTCREVLRATNAF